MKLSVVVQAGGESKRMGRDKGLVPFLGRPLIQRIINRVEGIADELLVTSNRPEDYAFLGRPVYRDIVPERGALSGLYTAFSIARFPLVAVVACDMAFVSADLLLAECDIMQEPAVDGVVPENEKGYEPFHAVYRRIPCQQAVREALESGEKCATKWLPRMNIRWFTVEQMAAMRVGKDAFFNLNTPQDLQWAEVYAQNETMVGEYA